MTNRSTIDKFIEMHMTPIAGAPEYSLCLTGSSSMKNTTRRRMISEEKT